MPKCWSSKRKRFLPIARQLAVTGYASANSPCFSGLRAWPPCSRSVAIWLVARLTTARRANSPPLASSLRGELQARIAAGGVGTAPCPRWVKPRRSTLPSTSPPCCRQRNGMMYRCSCLLRSPPSCSRCSSY